VFVSSRGTRRTALTKRVFSGREWTGALRIPFLYNIVQYCTYRNTIPIDGDQRPTSRPSAACEVLCATQRSVAANCAPAIKKGAINILF
jgi:hypothetical protein